MSPKFTFAFADANCAYGVPEDSDKEMLARHACTKGKVIRRFEEAANPTVGYLLAWPDDYAGMMAYVVGRSGQTLQLAVCWPFARDGRVHQLTIDRVWYDETMHLAAVKGFIGDLSVTVFDTFCFNSQRPLQHNEMTTCKIVGWATELEFADIEPHSFPLRDLSPSMRDAFQHSLDEDGNLTIQQKGMAALLPAFASESPLYNFRGTIKAARWAGKFMNSPFCVLTITVSRLGESDFDLDIFATVLLIGDLKLRIGDDLTGHVWLQGDFAASAKSERVLTP